MSDRYQGYDLPASIDAVLDLAEDAIHAHERELSVRSLFSMLLHVSHVADWYLCELIEAGDFDFLSAKQRKSLKPGNLGKVDPRYLHWERVRRLANGYKHGDQAFLSGPEGFRHGWIPQGPAWKDTNFWSTKGSPSDGHSLIEGCKTFIAAFREDVASGRAREIFITSKKEEG